jgi:hypothetical protein
MHLCLLHAGVPLPLLPHEVAVKGLRPEWSQDLPAFFRPLQQLAEACWVHTPEDRCAACAEGRVCIDAVQWALLTDVPSPMLGA